MVPKTGWYIDTDDLKNACDDKTRVLYISQVNATTGQFIDISNLSEHLKSSKVTLILDASHALGIVPVQGHLADFTVSSCYKFALGIHEGIFAWNQSRTRDFIPFGVGWSSATAGDKRDEFFLKPGAKRVEYGNAGHLGAYLLDESLDYLNNFGLARISNHAREMCKKVLDGLKPTHLEIITPQNPYEIAGNVAFAFKDPESIVKKAEAEVDSEELIQAHLRYAKERDSVLPDSYQGHRPSAGVGGTRQGVKCLHAHYAWFLAGGDDPVGRWVHNQLKEENE